MISVKGASFGRFGGWRRRYPGGSECRSIFLTVSRAMPNRLAASRWLRPSTWQASRTRRYRSTVYILPPSISKKIEGYRWQSFTPPAAGKSRRFRGLICHRRSHSIRFQLRPFHHERGYRSGSRPRARGFGFALFRTGQDASVRLISPAQYHTSRSRTFSMPSLEDLFGLAVLVCIGRGNEFGEATGSSILASFTSCG